MQARVKILDTKLEKTGHNKFAGYKYFELGDFLPPAQRIFNDLGLCGVISYAVDYATLSITDTEDGSMIVITSPMATAQLKGAHDIQNLGACETYQRRYLWMTALEITESDPIDAADSLEPKPIKPIPKPITSPIPKPVPTPPAVIEGKGGDWNLKVEANPEANTTEWASLVCDSTELMLDTCGSKADVMSVFKVNRVIFDRLQADAPDEYKNLLTKFTAAREKYESVS
jgi:hypothetical protein